MATTKMIQSLERAAMILELFQNQVTELGLKEIVEKHGFWYRKQSYGIRISYAEQRESEILSWS